MKKIVAPAFLLCLLITSVSNFSFAATETADMKTSYCATQSSICGTAPEDFTALLDFVREMSTSIKTVGTQ
jgi:hypothetical protein